MNKYLTIILLFIANNIYAQEIDVNDLEISFNRINSGQILPSDHQTLEYLRRYENDSLIIRKMFTDKNGTNKLEIKVVNPCKQSENIDEIRVDGIINYIIIRLQCKDRSRPASTDTLTYYNPNVPMSLIHLEESNITLKTIAGKQAVFIPFAYCMSAGDDDIRIAYIVFYDHQKYFYHINLRGQDFANYKIVDDLDEKFKALPPKLKKGFIQLVQSQCDTILQSIGIMPDDNLYLKQYYADSTQVGRKGYNKVELAHYIGDSVFVRIRFYSKTPKQTWTMKQEFVFEKDLISDCDMQIADFNNDGFGDMTYASATAARGANEIRRLFIYDKKKDELIFLKNSDKFSNLSYNKTLNCITEFSVYGCCATTFLTIQGDRLKPFASVELCEDGELTVREYDKSGKEKNVKREINHEFDPSSSFENYKPLKQ